MSEKRVKQKWIDPYTGQSLPIAGSKPLDDVKKDIKFERILSTIRLAALLLIVLYFLAREYVPYWIGILKEYLAR